ncbi:tRNA-dihydrouridine(20a 20b) synthase [Hyphodiscus hymeniophilus]|uniref:tRNA-dihydrouridine(20a/20b) synthase [NAD(P)+] n=1 Tax=Hyphodiscus hymeniophilus TaxID=353542 RepID=A0A9P7AY59_9HELO|nr:tRNA-dihydrouridine(20a 20b) synthase [Hyphodiscus hymeniophilus]
MLDIEKLDGERVSPSLDINPLKLFDIAKSQGRPLYAAAPMVRYSKLAFRQTVAEYGADLAWTPMILAKEFNRSIFARDSDFTTSIKVPPTIVQFGCNSPIELSRATTLLAPYVNGVDINCGCPQSWACAETLGAALMHKRELVAEMVKEAKSALKRDGFEGKKTVSVKIRIHKDLRDTVDFINTVQAAGVDFLTIHGRLRSTPSSQPVNLKAIEILTSHTTVPTLSNGDVFTVADAKLHAEVTGVGGVMSARGILQNPALFAGFDSCPWEAVEMFMNKVTRAPIPFKLVVHHVSEMVGSDRAGGQTGGGAGPLLSKDQRMEMMTCQSMLELMDFLDGIREVRRL